MRATFIRLAGTAAVLLAGAVCLADAPAVPRDGDGLSDLQGFLDAQLAAGGKKVVIPPGRYRVRPGRRQHLLLADLAGVQIVADGVEMICTETTRAVTISRCRNVTVRGLIVDYDPLPFTQGRIVKMSADKLVHEIELFAGYPRSDKADEFKYEIFRGDSRTLRFGDYHDFTVRRLGPARLRVTKDRRYLNAADKPEQVGDVIAIGATHAPGGKIPHAVYTERSAGVRLEAITLYASNCFGFMETQCDRTTYLRCRIDRRAAADDPVKRGDPRIRSLNADAFHSKHALRGPAILECAARFQGDDCVNICGDYHLVAAANGDALRVLAKRAMDIEPDEPVELLTYDGRRLPDAKVVEIAPDGAINEAEKRFLSRQPMNEDLRLNRGGALTKAYRVRLDRAVTLPTGSLICSTRRRGDGFTVRGCDFGYNRSRGILIKASGGEVSGNRLTANWGQAVKVAPEFWWLESGSSSDVRITGNVIRNCRDIAIAVYALGGSREIAPAGAHRNITIAGNRITGCPLPGILVTSTRGLTLADNVLQPAKGTPIPPHVRHTLLSDRKLQPIMRINADPGGP